MKLCIVLFLLFLSLEAVSATSFTRLFGAALAVHKKAKKDATKVNVAHNKSKKIKVTPVDRLNEGPEGLRKAESSSPAVDGGGRRESKAVKVAQQQDAMIGREEMFLTIAQMLLSRFILKVNYTDPKALLYSRATFVAYLVLFQALIWLLKHHINKRDDNTILAVSPSSGMDSLLNTVGRISGQSAMTNTLLSLSKLTNGAAVKTLTIKAHDLEHVQKLSSKLYFDLSMTSLLHYLFGFQSLVLLTPMRGLASLLKNQLVLLHVFRLKPVGKLTRPFKTPFEEFIGSLVNPKTPASPHVQVESADNSPKSAKSSVSKTRVDNIASSIDTAEAVEAETGEDSVVETADAAVVDDSDQVEQVTENEEEQEEEEGEGGEGDEGEETASVNDDAGAQESDSGVANVNDEKEEGSTDNEVEAEDAEQEGEECEVEEVDGGAEGEEEEGDSENDGVEDDEQDAPEDDITDDEGQEVEDQDSEDAVGDSGEGETDNSDEIDEEETEDSELLEAIDHFGE